MKITHLQTFVSIVDSGSLVRAAAQMNVTQSTVTARLQRLEDAVGQPLLVRDKSGVTLTPAGVKLLNYARMISGLWRQARRETALPAGLEAVCTLGCHPDLWDGPGRRAVDLMSGNPARMALTLLRGQEGDLDRWLGEGTVDMILTYRAGSRSGFSVHELPAEDLRLYATRENARVTGNDDYVFVDLGEEFRNRHGEDYFDAGTARVVFSAPAWALEYLLDRGGMAYLPRDLAQGAVDGGRLHEVVGAPAYARKRFLLVRDSAARSRDWMEGFITAMMGDESAAYA